MNANSSDIPQQAGRREWIGVAVLALPSMLVVMDLTVLFLAIPKLTADLQPSSTQLLWITDVYGFLIAGSLIAMGALGDRLGRRKLLLTGAAGFGLASLLSAFATSPEMLIAARALQGLAGATLLPSTMALVFNMFPDEGQRTKALGVVMSSFAAGAALGPVVGGVLLSEFPWGSVFLLNVPVMALLLVLGPRVLPEFRNPEAGRVDAPSVLLSIAAALTAIYGIKEMARDGVAASPALVTLAGLVLGALFVARQFRLSEPLIDMRLFRSKVFSTALGSNVVVAFVQYGIFLFTSQYLQLGLGLTALEAGLAGLPSIAALMFASNAVPKLVGRVRPGSAIAGGMVVTSLGFLALTQLEAGSGLILIMAATSALTVGVAPGMVLGTQLIVGAVPPERAGVASGMGQTANELGGAMGIALLGSLGTAIYRGGMEDGVPAEVPAGAADAARDTFAGAAEAANALPAQVLGSANQAFVDGLHAVAATNALLMAAMAVVAGVVLRRVAAPSGAEAPAADAGESPAIAPVPAAEAA